ncbi:hypothetical protein OCV51_08515 [Faecalicatena acetigenes]|uniref:N4-gp56 family major capsid protein n=1 Tax=Faecalicatena acetigenes TaxID=2981790 RepID=A0ABT2TBW2_9FIRM|nr:hypothetical protein [Faecalicatena acetigenes]MCU6747691.1 hypothetical protein [Faecalicatena acetigenes]SCI03853.1 Uncharacterised protein [uncultured Clostridium sp.]
MANELTTIYAPKTDELFKAESKMSLLTNTDYNWDGAHAIRLWKISTAKMNDYARNKSEDDGRVSRYGSLLDLGSQTEILTLSKDRSFIFNIDKLDMDETNQQLEAGSALARQLREVVVPEVDKYVYGKMTTGAGKKVTKALTKTDVYTAILAGSEYMDDAEVPDTERILVVTPATYTLLKQATEFDNTDVGADMKLKGVVAYLDGMAVVRVPASRLPENFGFMIAHPSACTAPVKLNDYNVHQNTPLSSGDVVTGRVVYDAFVLDNKKDGIYYHAIA